MCKGRNIKGEHVEGFDAVNNVVYDHSSAGTDGKAFRGSPKGANFINNAVKEGPQTATNHDAYANDPTYQGGNGYPNSVYQSGNIGRTSGGAGFTLNWDLGNAARGAFYDADPASASHGSLPYVTADNTMIANVIAGAGRTFHDSVDNNVRTWATNGTDPGNYYQGVGFGSPNPPNPPI